VTVSLSIGRAGAAIVSVVLPIAQSGVALPRDQSRMEKKDVELKASVEAFATAATVAYPEFRFRTLQHLTWEQPGFTHHGVLVDGKTVWEVSGGADSFTSLDNAAYQKLNAVVNIRDRKGEGDGVVVGNVLEQDIHEASIRLGAVFICWNVTWLSSDRSEPVYCGFRKNCEHATNYICIGEWKSEQGEQAEAFVQESLTAAKSAFFRFFEFLLENPEVAVAGLLVGGSAAVGYYLAEKDRQTKRK
jgi:hypothetical protein